MGILASKRGKRILGVADVGDEYRFSIDSSIPGHDAIYVNKNTGKTLVEFIMVRENIPAKLRHEVFKRDNYRCRECGATNKETTLEIDHIVPVAKGGSNNLANLQTLCKACNRAKYTRTWVGGKVTTNSINNCLEIDNDLYKLNEKQRRINLKKYKSHYSTCGTKLSKTNANLNQDTSNDINSKEGKDNDNKIKQDFMKQSNHTSNNTIFYNSEDFIEHLTSDGVFLSCFIPNYVQDYKNDIKIKDNTIIKVSRNVKMLTDGVYIEDVFPNKTLRILWDEILDIKISSKRLKITKDEKNFILINLPNNVAIIEDIKDLILNKRNIDDVRESHPIPNQKNIDDSKENSVVSRIKNFFNG